MPSLKLMLSFLKQKRPPFSYTCNFTNGFASADLRVKYFSNLARLLIFFFLLWRCGPTQSMASSFLRFLDHTQRCITGCRTPLDA